MNRSNKDSNGEAEIETTSLEQLPWFHGNMSTHSAEALLMTGGVEGSYLVRVYDPSKNLYCVSARGKDEVKHFKLEKQDDCMYTFGDTPFDSFDELMKHFGNQPILCSNAGNLSLNFELGTLVTLKYPYPRHVEEPEIFDEVKMQSTMKLESNSKSLEGTLRAMPFATKSGYLTKQGGTVKTWKQRWFVCIKNHLSYFEDKNDGKPIHTINLDECNDCLRTELPGRNHSFSLSFRDRTWNFCAYSDEDVEDWVSLLKWKLQNNQKYQ